MRRQLGFDRHSCTTASNGLRFSGFVPRVDHEARVADGGTKSAATAELGDGSSLVPHRSAGASDALFVVRVVNGFRESALEDCLDVPQNSLLGLVDDSEFTGIIGVSRQKLEEHQRFIASEFDRDNFLGHALVAQRLSAQPLEPHALL